MRLTLFAILALLIASPGARAQSAVTVPTQYLEAEGRRIAYRSVGSGTPLILALRFRGNLDSWDPAFIDALAKDFRVIMFDYSGLGLSSGIAPTTMAQMVDDVRDLADGLKLDRFVLGGWSLGGAVVQEAAVAMPGRISHLLIIGSAPPGHAFGAPQKAFLDAAFKPVNDLADEEVLFFLPTNATSRAAAKASHDRIAARQADRSTPVPPSAFAGLFQAAADFRNDDSGVTKFLLDTRIPILIIAGDHDVSCRVEDWYALSGRLASARLMVMPQTGHAPQHQFPEEVAAQIATFVATNGGR
ncbi:alpha/beta fold hydrolase [Sphingomonas sp. CJ99]